jgi:hypothetical protein
MNSGESLLYFPIAVSTANCSDVGITAHSIDLPAGDWDLSLPVMGTRVCLLMRPSPPSSMSSQHAVSYVMVYLSEAGSCEVLTPRVLKEKAVEKRNAPTRERPEGKSPGAKTLFNVGRRLDMDGEDIAYISLRRNLG